MTRSRSPPPRPASGTGGGAQLIRVLTNILGGLHDENGHINIPDLTA
jgi:hypothetical protein